MDKIHLSQGLKNLRTAIFNVLEENLDENLILKQKSQNLPLNTQIFDIFEIFRIRLVAGNGRWPIENRPEGAI
jgi:hypothetical protein